MINRTDPESILPNVDLEQWRRDIDVFAEAITSALDAIVSELSIACSGDEVPAASPKQAMTAKHVPVAKQAIRESTVKRAIASPSRDNQRASTFAGGSRLASIKEKLASRMKKD